MKIDNLFKSKLGYLDMKHLLSENYEYLELQL